MSRVLLASTGGSGPSEPLPTNTRAAAVHTNIGSMKNVATYATTSTWRTRHTTQRQVTSMVLAYGNQYLSAAGEANYTIAVSVEKLDGTLFPATWNSGSSSVVVTPSSHKFTDPIAISLANGEQFYIRARFTFATTGTARPHSAYKTSAARGEGTNFYGGGGDALTGTWSHLTDDVDPLLPQLILGTGGDNGPVRAVIGDSIMEPVDSWAVQHSNLNGWPRLVLAVGAQAMSHIADPTIRDRWMGDSILSSGADEAVCGMGRNDLTGAATIVSLQSNAIDVWEYLSATAGMDRVWQTTCTPLTTSTDAWTTVGNQTAGDSGEPRRLAWNAWLRDGAPISGGVAVATGGVGTRAGEVGHPLTGIVDTADAAESSLNSGKWKAGWTSDGIHPNATGKTGIATSVTFPT